ncbi:ABC transporter ATP-binding protein [Methanobacterium sp. BAmetb5]|jgi:NitT/TauT family transport system ATP-binding protein|uniref:ABC transporter ATP-binding protein n=1 Tax=Methanobacterium sp. BAmetb5 TaxID=2025351 RepID=UPI000E94A362|nr:ABC transporter ATP-binding protein [Methanobacterium sp. BAmetb5]AXV39297.1 MAG: sulfonate ABC transporter ATP-binding protein [Methanobacterium sp. BAmetb5]
MANITIENVSMKFELDDSEVTALTGINLKLNDGDFVSIIGPSGCGKSTLIDIIAGLKKPSQGKVLVENKEVNKPGSDFGIVFQDYSLFPWMSAYENLYFAIEHTNKKLSKEEIKRKSKKYLDTVGLSKFADKFPRTLSGGMRQRLAIARMFAIKPKAFLMDEPFGALDALNKVYMQDLLVYLWTRGDKRETTLYVTHDVDEALFFSDRIVVMTPSPGRIKEIINVDFPRPRCRVDIAKSAEYMSLRSKLISLLHDEMLESIAEQEKHLRDLK